MTSATSVSTTKKLSSTMLVTSTYYIIPTTLTTSLNVTKTVTASRSTSTLETVSSASSTGKGQTAYCLHADDNTKVPCSTTAVVGASPSPSVEASHAVNLNGAPHVVDASRYCSAVAAVAMLLCVHRLGPVSLAFVVADLITQRGMGSIVFVVVGLLFILMGA